MQQLIDTLDKNTAAFKSAFGTLTEQELNAKPTAESWSIAQNIEHLIIINESYFPTIQNLLEGTHKTGWVGKIGFLNGLMGNFILQSVRPEFEKKIKTFPIWEPTAEAIGGDIVARFIDHQQALKDRIVACEELMRQGVVIASPANRNIHYRLDKAFEILVTHEQRHFNQCRALLEAIKSKV